jgi:gluconolactonase
MKAQRSVFVGSAMIAGCSLAVLTNQSTLARGAAQLSAGQMEIHGVLAAGAQLEIVKDGFGNLDGAVSGPDGSFYFSDAGVGQTHRIRPDGTIEVFSDQNNGSTGLGFDPKGRLIALEGIIGRVVAIDAKKNLTVLAASPGGGAGYAPNDLIVDSLGGIYFTDPAIRSQGGDTRASRVLYVKPGQPAALITDAIKRPTGITLALDGKMLLIADGDGGAIMAMDLRPDGSAANLRSWLELKNIPTGRIGVPEGLAIDSDGRLYVVTVVGVQVYSRAGEYLGAIVTPRLPSNVAFGGADRKTLYITARSTLYRIRTLSAGPSDRAK